MMKIFNVGVKGLIVKDNKVLLLKRVDTFRDGFFWDIPGGRIDDEEDPAETLARELREELPSIGGFKIHELVHARRLDRDLKDGQGLFLVYYHVEADDFDIILSDEHVGFSWVNLEDLDSLQEGSVRIDPGCLQALKNLK